MSIRAERVRVRRGRTILLDEVTADLRVGELTAVIGPNGAGKSTFVRCLAGELRPDEGRVTLDGRPLTDFSSRELALRRAVLPQLSDLDFPFRVRDVVRLGRLPHHDAGQPSGEAAIHRSVEALTLTPMVDRAFGQLSGGERQRVHMARVLAQVDGSPGAWLFLDEPTSALDLRHQHGLLRLVRGFTRRGGGALVVLHDLNLASRYADQVLLLDRGRTVAFGRAEDVLTGARLEAVFRVPIRRHSVPVDGAVIGTGST